jgi:hypothetical protein
VSGMPALQCTAMPDAETPRFRVSNEGDPIPPVDPEDLKRRWSTRKQRLTCEATRAAQSQESDRVAVAHRFRMVSMLEGFNHGQLLAPWKHGEELDDAVFRLAATFPIRPLRQHTYMVPGDSMHGFDPNAFVEKLVEETGISHTWEPALAKVSGGLCYRTIRVGRTGQGPPDAKAGEEDPKKFMVPSEREAKNAARELLWAVWSKCQPNLSRASGNHELHVSSVAWHFADFAIDNIDLAREFVSVMSGVGGGRPLEIVLDLERNASWGDYLECSVCQRLMREHSDKEMAQCSQALPPGTTLYRVRTS